MSGDHNMHQKPRSFVDRYEKVRELVKDPTLRVKDIAEQTGYDKGHVSRLRKEASKKEWVGLTLDEVNECLDKGRYIAIDVARFMAIKLREKNT